MSVLMHIFLYSFYFYNYIPKLLFYLYNYFQKPKTTNNLLLEKKCVISLVFNNVNENKKYSNKLR